MEGLLLAFLLILICAMGVEIRCIFLAAEKLRTATRNDAVGTASLDEGGLRLMPFEEELLYRSSRILSPLVEAAGLHEMKCRYWIFVGTEACFDRR